ncbi:C45 family autoproteolytic acyltransferase/hydolase [Clostridium estertheticum]|uniref:C45 family autoproteolytic acyltransferase/hydolase n=1 Tax=Clostridium estertheticum TaxID=238834 RepID=UPI001C0CA917|nr:C45 family peptidase [Clostridium estertheticum]MBU3187481.1 C45 family peptidase [Clostridium estertheticum]
MKEITAYFKKFEGTSYEVGIQIGQWVLAHSTMIDMALLSPDTYPQDKLLAITELLDKYCSGINEEIRGFADTIGVSRDQVIFYAMTYLERGCSLMAALPAKTENGHTMMARNYDFNDEMEEMCFAKTNVKGKYSHIGSLLNLFGRCDGMNEHGLAACKASNGLPVGNFEGGQKSGVTGFQFWVVIRSILENCKNVEEAIDFAMNAPIGYNINLMLADKNNKIAFLQCMDGHKSYEILDNNSNKTYLSATNHVLFPELKVYEKMIIKNSELRNDVIVKTLKAKKKLSCNDLKGLLSTSYPQGLCCHYYEEFFGTLRSMIFDVTDGTIEMTFGSPQSNEWRTFTIKSNEEQEYMVKLPYERADKAFYDITYLS